MFGSGKKINLSNSLKCGNRSCYKNSLCPSYSDIFNIGQAIVELSSRVGLLQKKSQGSISIELLTHQTIFQINLISTFLSVRENNGNVLF